MWVQCEVILHSEFAQILYMFVQMRVPQCELLAMNQCLPVCSLAPDGLSECGTAEEFDASS